MNSERADTHALRVLVVEDNDDHAELLRRAFDRCSVENVLQRVADGSQAIEVLHQQTRSAQLPNLVLLDINLPGISGHDVLVHIRSDASTQSIPVIVLSTSENEPDRRRAYQNHANSYLKKPDHFAQWCEMIQALAVYWGTWNVWPVQDPTPRVV